MSFNVHKKSAGDLIGAHLVDAVNQQIATAPEHEHELIRGAADAAVDAIGEANEEHSVDVAISGSITDNARSLSMTVTVTRIRPDASKRTGANAKPWAPSKGPFAATRSERDRTTGGPANPPAGTGG